MLYYNGEWKCTPSWHFTRSEKKDWTASKYGGHGFRLPLTTFVRTVKCDSALTVRGALFFWLECLCLCKVRHEVSSNVYFCRIFARYGRSYLEWINCVLGFMICTYLCTGIGFILIFKAKGRCGGDFSIHNWYFELHAEYFVWMKMLNVAGTGLDVVEPVTPIPAYGHTLWTLFGLTIHILP